MCARCGTERTLRTEAFDSALAARVSYFEQEGSDDIPNCNHHRESVLGASDPVCGAVD
jgi:hypothetical protein